MSQITFLYQLQTIDSEIDRINKRIDAINTIISSDQEVIKSLASLEGSKKKQSLQLKSLEKIEDEVSRNKTKIKQSEDKLYSGVVKNPKELQDLQTEIKSIKNRITDLEDEQLEIMLVLEEIEAEVKQKDLSYQQLVEEKTKNNASLLQEKKDLEIDLQKQLTQKAPAINQISEDVLAKYEHLRKIRSGVAVAILDDNTCSACGTSLTSSDVQKVRAHDADYFCSSCKRFLFSG
jgi:predicted  nucleic acid-binding Zn-ribbon protein